MEHSGEELFKHVPFRIHQVSNNTSFLVKCSYKLLNVEFSEILVYFRMKNAKMSSIILP